MRVLKRHPDGGTDETDVPEASSAEEPVVTSPPDPTDTPDTTATTATATEVVTDPWSPSDAVVAVVGAGLALIGAIALVRAGVDKSWYRPVVHVLGFRHTALLGLLELGAGVLLMLSAPLRSRAAPALLGLAGAVVAALAAVEHSHVQQQLAIERNWAWILAAAGIFVAVVSLVPPRRHRVERSLVPG